MRKIDTSADFYLAASGGSAVSRTVKSKIFGFGKEVDERGDAADSAVALEAKVSVKGVDAGGLVPEKSHDRAQIEAPINNMGENLAGTDRSQDMDHWYPVSEEELGQVELVMTDSGKLKTVMVRRPSSTQACIVDWINFTVLEDTFFKTARQTLVTDDQIIEEASRQFEKVFGFGITDKRDRGMNFYRESWVLGDGMGFVCFGGQRATMLVSLTGQGCQNALAGWESRLHSFLTNVAVRPSISRIDLAHDDFTGAHLSVDWADAQWDAGGFSFKVGGRPPEIQHVGNWKRPSGKGRTLTVGQRTSSKFCRFYEKGRKEGDKTSPWCRCEIEFKNTNTVIPPDVLLNPTGFFLGAYPCMAQFVEVQTPQRMDVKKKTAKIVMDAAAEWLHKQAGKYLRVFRELHGDKAALDLLCNSDEDYWPKRLLPLTSDHRSGPVPVHKQTPVPVPSFMQFITTVPCYGLNGENGFA